jgi:translation initiation factor 3 subunit B
MEFENAEQAAVAIKKFNGHRLDKAHVFAVNRLSDIDSYHNYSDDFAPPADQPFENRVGIYRVSSKEVGL